MEMMVMLVGIAIGAYFTKLLEESGKQSFTKEEIINLQAKATMFASSEIAEQKKKREEKEEETVYPKPMSDISS